MNEREKFSQMGWVNGFYRKRVRESLTGQTLTSQSLTNQMSSYQEPDLVNG